MKQLNIVSYFFACICCKDRTGLDRVLSDRLVISYNDTKLSERRPSKYIIEQFGKHVSNAERSEIKIVRHSRYHIFGEYSYISAECRLIIYDKTNVCEDWFRLNIIFRESEIVCIQMVCYEILTRKHIIATKDRIIICPENQIYFLESDNNHIRWHCIGGEFRERSTIADRARLLSDRFVNVRRSHWINMDFITEMQWCEMTVYPDQKIPIPRAKYNFVKDRITEWNKPDNKE